jgi:uncharacterized protein YfaS (alpha-2-macroglobulin family)
MEHFERRIAMNRWKSARRASRLLLLLAAAAACLGQSENDPYFALFTTRTFGPGGKATVQLSAWNVDSLEFRVYRIQDPLAFFEELPDAHQFGGRAPRAAGQRTLLERVHEWKRGLRATIRRALRHQFTASPSEKLGLREEAPPPDLKTGHNETHYAEAPLLNSQQLVLSFQQPIRSHSRWERSTVNLGLKDKGFYLVEAVKGQLCAYTLAMVSDLVMISKPGSAGVVNFVVDRRTGQPIAEAKISMLARDANLGEASTSPDGIAEFSYKGKNPTDLRLVARHGGDYAVNVVGSGAPGDSDQWTGYSYTDRPVYRPGHTVHFKALLRTRETAGYALPSAKTVSVTVNDADQKPVYQKTLAISPTGSIHDEFTLAPTASLGSYNLQVKSGDSFVTSADFEVQEYKKPEYEVRILPAKPRVVEGDSTQVTIDSRYYFGEPVSGAKVTYAFYRSQYYFPLWYDPDDDSMEQQGDQGDQGDADDSGDQVAETEGQLDADGKLTVTLPTKIAKNHTDYVYRVEARVTDQGQREITGKGWVVATYGSYVVHVTPDRYFYEPGSRGDFLVEARDYDNNPVRARLHVELLHWNFRDPDGPQTVSSSDVDTGAEGTAKVQMAIPSEGGSYRVKVSAHTPEGRDIEDYDYLLVSGNGSFDFGSGEHNLQIATDKKSYRAGETAHLLIVTGKPNAAVLVSVEGRDVRQYKVLRSKESTVAYDVPVGAGDEPGIWVAAGFVNNGIYNAGAKYIRVPPKEHKLNVKLSTDKAQYLPGQPAEYTIEATTAQGQPAPRAEFSLGVVDEAIYAIRPDDTQDILSAFFSKEWNRVYDSVSLSYWFQGEAGKRRMRLSELRPPSRLAQLKPERLVQPKVRKAFPDTAFWSADVTTDASGHARAKVEFPDSLTTWRATARGATPDTKVGNATLKTIVRKNLIVRLVVPRFFVQGDEVVISVLVHNYLTTTKKARVSLDATGLDMLDGATRDLEIPSRGEIKLDWRVRAQQVRAATLTGKALTNEESDALEMDLPVNVPGIAMARAHGGAMSAGGTAAFDLAFPDKVQPGSRLLSVRLAPSIAGSLFGALDYLVSFPYGCVEQTMSSFLPNITVAQAVKDLHLKTDLDQAALQERIHAGLDRLYNFQHPDGGWGWWESDDSHPFMTAYVVAGLVQARDAGTQVTQEAIDNGVGWLKKNLAQESRTAPDLRAYMVYALAVAGQSTPEMTGPVYDKRSALSPYGMALLGLALEQTQDGRAKAMADELERSAQQDQEQAWWRSDRDQMLDFSSDATPEATAWAVKFLSHQHADSPLLPKAALWLMNHRNEGYWWESTKQTAMVIYGLTDYLRHTNELNPNLTATVFVNDKAVLTRKLDQAVALAAPDLSLDESQLQPGVNHIRVTTSGAGRLYYSVRAEYYSGDEKLQKNGTTSLNILRDYFRLAPGRTGDRIVYDLAPLDGPLASGDIVAVRLTVTGSEWRYLMIEDPIPAGTEFIERDNVYELKARPTWWDYFFTRREQHDNRLAIFQTYFPQGQHQYFYLLKVVNPGVFQVSPARVGPMYQSDVMATTESRKVEVK